MTTATLPQLVGILPVILICNGRIFSASGLRVFDASRDREKKGPERAEWALDRASGPAGEVRKLPQKPPYFRRPPQ
jgi:hypothetical protein